MKKSSLGRLLAAAFVGGVIMFFWGYGFHTALGAVRPVLRPLPAEETIVPALAAGVPEQGMYFFPAYPENADDAAAMQAFTEKLRAGPRGMVIFNPAGGEMMSPAQLGREFGGGLVAAFLLALALAMMPFPVAARIAAAGALGLFAWASIEVSYWNWYGFTSDHMLAVLVEQGVGWLLCGVGIALVLGRTSLAGPARAPAGA